MTPAEVATHNAAIAAFRSEHHADPTYQETARWYWTQPGRRTIEDACNAAAAWHLFDPLGIRQWSRRGVK